MLSTQAIGFLGQDAVIKEVNGKQVVNFSIAHSEKYKNAAGTQVESTTWVECSFWSESKVSEFLKKGTQVFIAGTPEARAWNDKDGNPRGTIHVRVSKIELLGSGKAAAPVENTVSNTPEPQKKDKKTAKEKVLEEAGLSNGPVDDLPF